MEWNAIQTDAKSRGRLIFAISQNQSKMRNDPGPWGDIAGGVCIGLSALWAALAYNGESFPLVGDVCETMPWKASLAQNAAAGVGADKTWREYWTAAVATFQCGTSKGLHATRYGKPTADFLWSIMSKAYGCYGVTLIGTVDDKAAIHALALRHGHDNRYHLFDADNFHVAMKGVETFKGFVHDYLHATKYDKMFWQLTGITGITPPIS
jgi:hypothetical protein